MVNKSNDIIGTVPILLKLQASIRMPQHTTQPALFPWTECSEGVYRRPRHNNYRTYRFLKTKAELLKNVSSGINTLMEDLDCQVEDLGNGEFVLSSNDVKGLCCFILKRMRESQGLS